MDLSKITQFKISLSQILSYNPNPNYTIKLVCLDNIDYFKNDVKSIIEYHRRDLIWDGIPSYKDVLERLEFGSKFYLWLKNGEAIGWHWYNTNHITLDWKTSFQKLKENELYGGSSFLNVNARKLPSPAFLFYNMGVEAMLSNENKDTLYLYVDNWNTPSIKLCKKCGWKEFDFIKK